MKEATTGLQDKNFVAALPSFRTNVALSYLLGHAATIAGIALVRLIPDQKADALRRLRDWPRQRAYTIAAIGMLTAGFWFGTVGTFLQLKGR